jgi:cytidyltransferase-like protein
LDKFELAGLGGTFDHLHDGHKLLISTAFRIAKKVAIALTNEELLKNKAEKELIESYETRKQNLENFIIEELGQFKDSFEIIPLSDPFGPAITSEDLEIHVSSDETIEMSKKINEYRIKNGLKPLVLVAIPIVTDIKDKKISSTDIRTSLK